MALGQTDQYCDNIMIPTNFWKLKSPMDLGIVIDKSQVDTRGRHLSVVKDILSVESNSMAGILLAPAREELQNVHKSNTLFPVGDKI